MSENVENIIETRCFNMHHHDVVPLLQLPFHVSHCAPLLSILYTTLETDTSICDGIDSFGQNVFGK